MHLLLISLDTLRADVAYSGKFPAIESLRRRGVTFTSTVASSPLTPISHATILTGLQPPSHGVRHLFKEQMATGVVTLAERLKQQGYRTGAVVASPGMNSWYGLGRGFDHYDDWVPPLADGRDALELVDVELRGTALKRAPLVVDRALAWLDEQPLDVPTFLFAHFFDAHWPYGPPETFGNGAANPYEEEVAYMDHYLGRLLDGVEARGLTPDSTVTVCLSDHGEDLRGWYPNDHSDREEYAHERGHGCLLFDATQLVPLIIAAPGLDPRTVGSQVRLVDVTPTIAELLDVNDMAGEGTSLVPLARGAVAQLSLPAYFETFYPEELAATDIRWSHLLPLRGVRSEETKVVWEHGGERVDQYDLASDPSEHSPQRFFTP
jgi:arylsulfatase A-like enzyme